MVALLVVVVVVAGALAVALVVGLEVLLLLPHPVATIMVATSAATPSHPLRACVVTHHTNVVEHPELVAQRLVRLAGVVGRENVLAGTDCGFAQGAFIQRVHPEVQWAKLRALAEGAQMASRELWSAKAAV